MKLGRTTLDDRITALRAEIDTFIDERTARVAKECPGVPSGVLRNLITAQSPGCQCAVYLHILETDRKSEEAA